MYNVDYPETQPHYHYLMLSQASQHNSFRILLAFLHSAGFFTFCLLFHILLAFLHCACILAFCVLVCIVLSLYSDYAAVYTFQ